MDVIKLSNEILSNELEDVTKIKEKYSYRAWSNSPYPVDENINQRIVLYHGDIEQLKADAIINPSNEHLTQLGFVLGLAGPELEEFVRRKLRYCPTGEVRLTPGFSSNFKFIIHAVPPKYKAKYKTAAETALFHTYFRILETMIEKKIRSCVLPLLTTNKGNLPLEEHCHIQLRTIRRILERKRYEFDRIVLYLESSEALAAYALPFRCYFPRSELDEEVACHFLDADSLGGPNGEPVILERQIRIKSKPASLVWHPENSIDLRTGLELSTVVGKTAFSKMRDLGETTVSASSQHRQNLTVSRVSPLKRQYCSIC